MDVVKYKEFDLVFFDMEVLPSWEPEHITDKNVLKVIKSWASDGEYKGFWRGYDVLSEETGYSVKKLKKVMKRLLKNKKVTYESCFIENRIHGKGYFFKQW